MFSPTGPQFEDEVRNIARNLFSNGIGQGSEIINGRERDGVFWNGQYYTVIEATTLKTKEKAEYDAEKTHALVSEIRKLHFMAQGYLVTLFEPTPEQKDIIKKKGCDKSVKILSFDEFRSKIFDSLSYINNREKKKFGSVYDYVKNTWELPITDFVEPTISFLEGGVEAGKIDIKQIISGLCEGKKYVLVAEYGVGKSMILRHLFFELAKSFRAKKTFRTPIAINLRDHIGQTDPIELLERHARANAANPQSLVAAWNSGYVDLLIDGFDELSTRGWTGNVRKLREYRRASHSVVRKLIQETPKGCGVIIAGRDAYFDSYKELRNSLGVSYEQFYLCRVHLFDENQAVQFLKKKGIGIALPDWIPNRPLLLTYIVTKNLLQSVIAVESRVEFAQGSAWLSLIDMIAQRESEQSEGIDKDALIEFLGALAIRARQATYGAASFTPQQMEEIFSSVNGTAIMEDERNILLRLPGLGAAQDSERNRSFIDDDFMNVCCSYAIMKYTQNQFDDYSKNYGFEAMSMPMNAAGVEALSSHYVRAGLSHGIIKSAMKRAFTNESTQLAYDIFSALIRIVSVEFRVEFTEIEVSEVDLMDSVFDGKSVTFSNCLVGRVVLPTKDETNSNIVFKECMIGSIEGRVSYQDLDQSQFINCDIAEFTDEYSVNNEVLSSSLPLGVKVLVVTLRKIFRQYGSGRLESALYRGLDHRSKMLVPDVLEELKHFQFIFESGRRGKVIFQGNKSKRSEAIKIIQSPNASGSEVVKGCARLS